MEELRVVVCGPTPGLWLEMEQVESNSTFSTITSAGGGAGGAWGNKFPTICRSNPEDGGSGGGGAVNGPS